MMNGSSHRARNCRPLLRKQLAGGRWSPKTGKLGHFSLAGTATKSPENMCANSDTASVWSRSITTRPPYPALRQTRYPHYPSFRQTRHTPYPAFCQTCHPPSARTRDKDLRQPTKRTINQSRPLCTPQTAHGERRKRDGRALPDSVSGRGGRSSRTPRETMVDGEDNNNNDDGSGDRLASVVTVLAGCAAPRWLQRVPPLLLGRQGDRRRRGGDQRRQLVPFHSPQVPVLQEQGLFLLLLLGRP